MWSDPAFTGPPLKNILVVAIRNDPTRRRIWEDAFIAQMTQHSVTAVPSYKLFPDAVPDTDQIIKAVRENNFDAVLITHRLAGTTDAQYIPGYVTRQVITVYDSSTGRYYSHYDRVVHPGYVDSSKVSRNEIEVWSTSEGGAMIWSATSNTIDPTSVDAISNEIVNLVVPELAVKKIIPPEVKQ
jgi:hypothetical protein